MWWLVVATAAAGELTPPGSTSSRGGFGSSVSDVSVYMRADDVAYAMVDGGSGGARTRAWV